MASFKTIIGTGPQIPNEEPEKQIYLVTIAGTHIGQTFHILEEETILGRGDEANFLIDDPLVSRQHCTIKKSNNTAVLCDLESTNGTYVNFNQITEKTLNDGDFINIGTTVIKFLSSSSPEAQFHEEIYKLASLDGLTQIYHKKHFKELFEKEMSRTARHNLPLSLCMLDIDYFKKTNDTYGHQAGDMILVSVANKIKEQLRKEDIFARYGGEEFCILLPSTSSDDAYKKAEQIRKMIENSEFIYNDQTIKVTLSIGIHTIPNNGDTTVDAFIEKADKKLYLSKEGGRNQTTR